MWRVSMYEAHPEEQKYTWAQLSPLMVTTLISLAYPWCEASAKPFVHTYFYLFILIGG